MDDETLEEYFESTDDMRDWVQGMLDFTMESMLMISDEDISPRDLAEERGRRAYEDHPVDPEWDSNAVPETPSIHYDYGAALFSIPPSFLAMPAEYIADRTDLTNPSEYVLEHFTE